MESHVFIQDVAHKDIVVPVVRRSDSVACFAMASALAHAALTGSGLRTRDVGAVIASAPRSLPLRPAAIADAVTSQLGLKDTGAIGLSGPFAFHESLLFASSGISAQRFSHVLLVHVSADETAEGWRLSAHAMVMGTTKARVRCLGLVFGQAARGAADVAAADVCAQLKMGERPPSSVQWSGAEGHHGVDALSHFQSSAAAEERMLLGTREGNHWGAVALEAVAERMPVAVLPETSIDAHIERARLGGFPLSFARVSVRIVGAAELSPVVAEEVRLILRSSLRAFDDVRPLGGGEFLLSLPRADSKALDVLKTRLEGQLGELDFAGELTVAVGFSGVALEQSMMTAADVASRLQL